MQDISVIDKVSLDKVNIESNIIKLDKISIVQTKIKKEDILEIIQEGNHLIIKLKNGETLTIENYFVKNENDENSEVVFEGSECLFEALVWDNGVAGFKQLTGLEALLPIVSGGATGSIGSLPWIVGGVAGGIIAGVSDDGHDSEAHPPVDRLVAPTVEIENDQNNDGVLNNNELGATKTVSVVVTLPEGAVVGDKIVLTDQNGKSYEHVLTKENIEQGKVNLLVDRPAEGETLKVSAHIENAGGKSEESDSDQARVDTQTPEVNVNVTANYKAGTATVTFTFSEAIKGFDETDLTVSGGQIVPGSLVQNPDGTWTAQITGTQQGVPVEVTVKPESYTDESGNAGAQGSDEDISVKIDAIYPDENGGSVITGVTKPGNEVSVKIPGTDQVYTGTADENGHWTIVTDEPLKDGDKLTVTTPNHDKEPAVDEQPLPFVSIDPIAGDDFITEEELTTLVDENGLVSITGKVSNPSADMAITFNGKTYSGDQVTILPNGTWEIKVPVAEVDVNGQNNITAQGVVTDSQGTKFPSNEADRDVGADTTPPTVQIDIDDEGKITIQYDADVDPKSIQTDKISIVDKDGNPIEITLTPSEDGLTFTGQLPDGLQTNVTVTVPEKSYQDVNGNQGKQGTDHEPVDTKNPSLNISLNPDGTVVFTFSEDVKGFTSADILVNGANLVAGSLVDLGNGVWTAKLDNMPKDGTTVTVEVKNDTYTDLAGNLGTGALDQEIYIKVNTVTPNPETGGTTITGKTEPNNTVEVTVPGYDKPFTVTADPEGNWVVETDQPIQDGNSVTATTPNQDGDIIEDQIQLPFVSIDIIAGDDILDPSELAEIKTGTTLTVTGTISNPNADLTVTFNGKSYSGSHVTIHPNGTWSIQVPVEDIQSQNTVTAQATATTPEGTTVDSAPAIREPITSGSITVDVDNHGQITGTTTEVSAGQIVEITLIGHDKNGVEIETKITAVVGADGTYQAEVPAEFMDGDIQVFASTTDENNHPLTSTDQEPQLDRVDGTITVNVTPEGKITGTTTDVAPGSEVTLVITGQDKNGQPIEETIKVTVGQDGTFTGQVPPSLSNSDITVTGTTTDRNNKPLQDTDGVDAKAPTLEISLNPDGTVVFTFSEDVKGFTSADILVNGANLVAGSLVDLGNGVWTAKLDNMPKDGTTVTVEVKNDTYTDLAGNLGTGALDQEIYIKVNTVTPNPETGGTTITGKTEPNNTVEVTVPGYDKPFTVTADPEGNWVVETDQPIQDGNSVTATTPNQDGDIIEDQIQLPFVSIDIIAGDDILDPSELAEIKTGTTLTVTGTISNPNADLTVTFNGKSYSGSHVTIHPNGTWSIQVPVEDIQSQNTVTAQATATTPEGTTVDSAPAIREPITSGSITVDVDNHGQITGTTTEVSAGQTVEITLIGHDKNGVEIETKITAVVGADGTYQAEVPAEFMDGDIQVFASTTDENNHPLTSTDQEPQLDRTPPNVTVEVTPEGEIKVTFDPDVDPETITPEDFKITDKDGNPIEISLTPSEDGLTWTGKVPENTEGKVTVTVPEGSYEDTSGNPGQPGTSEENVNMLPPGVTVDITPDGEIKVTFDPDVDPETITPEDFKITDKDGNPIEISLTPSEDGLTWTGKVPENTEGKVTVTVPEGSYEDTSGNPGTPGAGEENVNMLPPGVTVDITPDGDIKVTFDPDVDPETITPEDFKITDKDGNPIEISLTPSEDGLTWTGKVPENTEGKVTVTVPEGSYEDTSGNPGQPGTGEENVNMLPPGVTVDITPDGEIKVTFDPDVDPETITPEDFKITDKDGNPIEISLTPSEDGLTWTGKVPENTEGKVTVTVPEGSYEDTSGNPGQPGTSEENVNMLPPGVTVDITPDGEIKVSFDPDVDPESIRPEDFKITDKDGNPIEISLTPSEDGLTWTGKVPENTEGKVTVTVPEGSYEDTSGNPGTPGAGEENVNMLPPGVTVDITPDGDIKVTFDPDVDPETITPEDFKITDKDGNPIEISLTPSEDGLTWTGKVPENTEGKVTVTVPEGSYEDTSGNPGQPGTGEENVNMLPPGVTVDITPDGEIKVTFDPDVDPETITPEDFKITDKDGNPIEISLTPSEDGLTWTGKVPENTEGKVTVTVPEGSYEDTSGNPGQPGTGEENVNMLPPGVTVDITPDGDIKVTFDPDVDPETIDPKTDIVITDKDGNPIEISLTPSEDGLTWTGKVPENTEGKVTVTVPDGSYEDTSGNPGTPGTGEENVNMLPPGVTVDITPDGEIKVTFDPDVDPETIDPKTDIVITDKDGNPIEISLTPSEDGLTWTGKVPENTEGKVTVTVPEGSYDDTSGNPGQPGTGEENVNMLPPGVTVDITPDGEIKVTFDPDVDPETIDPKTDIVITDKDGNPIEISLTPSEDGLTWTGKVPENTEGKVTVTVPEGSYEDTSGNPGQPGTGEENVNMLPPGVTVDITPDGEIKVSFDPDVDPESITPEDFKITDKDGNPIEITLTPSEDGLTWTGKVPENTEGKVTVTVPEGSYDDTSGNPGTPGAGEENVNMLPPGVTVDITPDGEIKVSFDPDVDPETITPEDFKITDKDGNPIEITLTPSEDGLTWTGKVPENTEGKVTVTVPDGSYEDTSGNPGQPGTGEENVNMLPPGVTVDITPDGEIKVSFDPDVDPETITPEDFKITDKDGNPIEISLTPSEDGLTWTGKVPENTEGKVTVTVPDGSYEDTSGNPGQPGTGEENVNMLPPGVTVDITPDGEIKVTFDPDVDPETIDPKTDIVITDKDGNPIEISLTPSEDGLTWTGKVPENTEGKVTVTVPEGSYEDTSGNPGTPGTGEENVNMLPPGVTVDITPDGEIKVTFDPDVDPETIDPKTDIVITDKDGNPIEITLTPSEDGLTWTGKVPENTEGKVTVTVPEGSYGDTSGNPGTPGTGEENVNMLPPGVTVDITPDGEIKVSFDPDVDPETIDPKTDIVITDKDGNPIEISLTPSEDGLTWIGKVPENTEGKVTVTVPEGSYEDTSGNPGQPGTGEENVNMLPPGVTVDITPDGEIKVSFDPDVDPESITPEDFKITDKDGNPIEISLTPSEDGLTWTGKVPENTEGKVTVTVPEGSYEDTSGNPGQPGTSEENVNMLPPGVTVDITPDGEIKVSFDPDVDPESITPEDFKITDKDGNSIEINLTPSEDGLTWTGKVPENTEGKVTVTVPEGSYEDTSGNPGTPGTGEENVNMLPPGVTVDITPEGEIKVTFDPDVDPETITPEDFKITDKDGNPIEISLTPSEDGLTWTGKVPENTEGKVTVTVPEGSYDDTSGNPGQPGMGEENVNMLPPGVTVDITPDGEIKVSFDPDVDPETITPEDFKITDKDGNPIEISLTPSEDGLTWTGKVPENTEGKVTVTVPEGSYEDTSGNPGTPGTGEENVNMLPPGVTVDITPDGEIKVSFDPDVDPETITPEDFKITDKDGNPIEITLTPGEDGLTWTGKVPENTEGKVTVTVPEGSYEDTSGNPGTPGTGEENVNMLPPGVTVDITPDGEIKVSFDPDVDPETITPEDFKITDKDGNPIEITLTPGEGGLTWTGKVPENTEGKVTVTVPEGSYEDTSGNPGTPGTSEENVNMLPPGVTVDITPDGEIKVSFDPDVDPETIDPKTDIVITDKDGNPIEISLTPSEDGLTWTGKVPENTEGKVTVTVPDGSYEDTSGNPGTPGTGEENVNMLPPGVTVDITPDGEIKVSFDPDVDPETITPEDFKITDKDGNPIDITLTPSEDGLIWTGKVPENTEGKVTVTVPEGSYEDTSGNPGTPGAGEENVNMLPPGVTVDITPDGEIKVTFDPDVDPETITPEDFKITDKDGNPIEITLTPSEDGLIWTGKVPENTEGQVNVEIPPTYKDESGNVGEPGTGTGNVDTVPPGVNIDITPDGKITITFDPDVDPETITPEDFKITDKDGNPIEITLTPSEDGLTWTGKVPPNVDGEVKVEVPPTDEAGNPTYTDEVGNPGTGGDKTVPVDTLPPKVNVEISEDRTSVTFIFNEAIQGFDASDIVVTGGTLKPDTLVDNGNGTWTAQLENTEKGNTVEVKVKDQSYTDLTNNAGAAGTDLDITIKITSVTPIAGSNDKLITGMTGANQEVTVILPNGDEITGIRSDENGYWELTTAIVEGTNDEITAQTKNQDQLTVEDIISLPFVSIDLVSGDDVINEAEYADLENTVTITGKVSNPDVTMTVTIAGKTYTGSQVTVNADGTWSVNVPKADVAKDFDITAEATSNTSGATSDEALRDVMVDIEPPKVTVEIDATGKITLKYDSDVDPNSIDLSQVTVKDTLGNVIPVNWNQSDRTGLNFDAMIDMPIDDIITVTVPKGSYQDLVGNLGLEGLDAEDIDNAAPDIESTVIKTDEDSMVNITWAQLGIADNSTDLNKLTVSFTQLPVNGTLYLNGQAVTDVNMLADLTKSDIDAGQLSFKPDLNEASTSTDSVYTTLDFEVHDGMNTSSGSVDVIVNAVADKPHLSFDILDWSPTGVNLNIQTWDGLKSIKIDGKTYDLLQGNGGGMPAETLKTVFEYLTSDKNTTHKPASSGETTSLTDGNVATYKGVAITGYVYLEKGHTYNYAGAADDSGMLIIGNEDPVFASWEGATTSGHSFTATESGFYTFDFYMHNQAGQGNYNFQLVDESHGDTISYYPDLDTALSGLNDFYQQTNPSVEWKVSDLIQSDANDKDHNGFHRPYFNLSGEVGQDISLGLLNTSLNDVDGSESLTLNFSGLVEGMMVYALAADGSRILLGTANAQGQLSFDVDGTHLNGASLVAVAPADFVVTDASLALKVKVEAVATEQSNGSTESSEIEFDMTLYPPANVAFKAMAFKENTTLEQDADLIFNVLSDDNLAGNTLTTVNDFTSNDHIDISSLLDHNANLENINEYLTVNYDAEQAQAVISIDRDGQAAHYQTAELLVLNQQTTDITLEQLLQNGQIII